MNKILDVVIVVFKVHVCNKWKLVFDNLLTFLQNQINLIILNIRQKKRERNEIYSILQYLMNTTS